VTWCAVREEYAEQALERLGLLPTGETEEFPESPISTAHLDTGWRIIWCNEYASPLLSEETLAEMSGEFDIVLCLIEEHVMASSSELWSGGKRQWWISHRGENGPKGLDADGTLPDCFPAIKTEMEKAQRAEGGDEADVDYIFEIPLQVVKCLVGFKHDEDYPHISKEQFVVLSRPARKGFFARLLGR
jgi:hypothetical protein